MGWLLSVFSKSRASMRTSEARAEARSASDESK